MVEIVPAILAKTPEDLYSKIRLLEPHVSRVHIDIVDGKFAPNTTLACHRELAQLDTRLQFDIHLMVQNPLATLEHWYSVKKADRFFVHVEAQQEDMLATLATLRAHQRWAGLAANPETEVSAIERLLLGTDLVLLMGVHPGFTGAQFLPSTVERVQALHAKHPTIPIGVDGGMNPETAKQVIAAGASIIVSSSYIMQSTDIAGALSELQKS